MFSDKRFIALLISLNILALPLTFFGVLSIGTWFYTLFTSIIKKSFGEESMLFLIFGIGPLFIGAIFLLVVLYINHIFWHAKKNNLPLPKKKIIIWIIILALIDIYTVVLPVLGSLFNK